MHEVGAVEMQLTKDNIKAFMLVLLDQSLDLWIHDAAN